MIAPLLRKAAVVTTLLLIATLTATAPVQADNRTLYGAVVLNQTDLAMKTHQFGHMGVVRVYYLTPPPANIWTTASLHDVYEAHDGVIVSFNANARSILSGQDDQAFKNFFDNAPRGEPIFWSYYHEPERVILDGEFTAVEYREAWVHLAHLAAAAHNSYLIPTLILLGWDLSPYADRNWREYLPPGQTVSVVGWDSYPPGGVTTPSPVSFIGDAVTASRAAHIRFGFGEFATATVKGRPNWLSVVGAYCQQVSAVFCSLYDSPYHGNALKYGTYEITDKASMAAWHKVVSP